MDQIVYPPFTDESGAVLYREVRRPPKRFHLEQADGNGGFVLGLNGVRRVPFNLAGILAAKADSQCLIVEGLKDVLTLESHGQLATTNCGGASGTGQWKEFAEAGYFETLNICILPDNDPAGCKHADGVASHLFGRCASLKVIPLPGLPHKGDVSDWLSAHTVEELLQLVADAPEWKPAAKEFPEVDSKPDRESRPTDDELRDRWLAQYPQTVFARSEFLRHHNGLWVAISENMIRREIESVLVGAKPEKIRPTKSLLNSVLDLAKAKTAMADDLFDVQGDYLVCNNGTLHIPTRTLGSWESSHYLTRGVDYDYDPHARRPAWDRFIGDLIYTLGSDTVELLQEFGGYGMTTDTSLEFALWLVGQMGGGKSTFIEGTRAAASDRVTTLGLRAIERSRFALGNLAGKTLATCCEQPSDFIAATDVLNAIISGESITIEKKFCHPYDINPTVKLLWAMNSKPRVSDPNNGIFRRVKIVTFPPIDPADVDPTLKERIKGEGAGILNWLLVGLDRLRERGYFIIPETVCEATREYQKHADVPASFLEDHCERDPSPAHDDINFRELSGELYRSYREWALDGGHKPSSITKVADDWERLGLTRRRIDGQSWWYGLRICARGLSV